MGCQDGELRQSFQVSSTLIRCQVKKVNESVTEMTVKDEASKKITVLPTFVAVPEIAG